MYLGCDTCSNDAEHWYTFGVATDKALGINDITTAKPHEINEIADDRPLRM